MSYQLSNRVVDAETGNGLPGVVITEIGRQANSQISDGGGFFTITVDSIDSPVSLSLDNYGDSAGAAGSYENESIPLYLISAPLSVKLPVILKQHAKQLPGTLITVFLIILVFKIFKLI